MEELKWRDELEKLLFEYSENEYASPAEIVLFVYRLLNEQKNEQNSGIERTIKIIYR